eukprot:3014285-Pyramimonas_sp.AAC.1
MQGDATSLSASVNEKQAQQDRAIAALRQDMLCLPSQLLDGRVAYVATASTRESDGSRRKVSRLCTTSQKDDVDPTKRYPTGFPRPPHETGRKKHFASIIGDFPECSEDTQIRNYKFCQVYTLHFKDETMAGFFHMRFNEYGYQWCDPRDNNMYPLRVRGDLPLRIQQHKK